MKKLLILILFVSSFHVFADTYPASTSYFVYSGLGSTPVDACTAFGNFNWPGSSYTWTVSTYNTCVRNGNDLGWPINTDYTCPSGGTVSGSNCINASPCLSPQVRSSSSPYTCITPVECRYPETDNGSGVCFNWTCPAGQNRNPVTMACQTPPTCAAPSQLYDSRTNTCYLAKLNCPGHTHANVSNDQCLADAPLACPSGQHDDGTYNCVADDAVGCRSNQQAGYINGVHQCIAKTNSEQAAADAAAAKTADSVAQAAADAAAAALAADPSNSAKQSANAAAQSALTSADTAAVTAQHISDSATFSSIDQTLKADQARELGKTSADMGQSCSTPPQCSGDAIMCEQVLTSFRASCVGNTATQSDADTALGGHTTLTGTDTTLASLDNSGLGLGSTCPVPHSYTVLNAPFVIDLSVFCSIATIFGKLILITASFVSLRLVSS